MYQTLSESASFHKRYDKTFWCVFQFAVLTAVHLQNANGKFHKVEYRHCSGEAESDKFTQDNVSNFITVSQVLQTVYQKTFGSQRTIQNHKTRCKTRLTEHLSTNNLLNSHQPAYYRRCSKMPIHLTEICRCHKTAVGYCNRVSADRGLTANRAPFCLRQLRLVLIYCRE